MCLRLIAASRALHEVNTRAIIMGERHSVTPRSAAVLLCWTLAVVGSGVAGKGCSHSQLSGCYTQSTCAELAKQHGAVGFCYEPTVDPDWGVCLLVNCTNWCPNASAPSGACATGVASLLASPTPRVSLPFY